MRKQDWQSVRRGEVLPWPERRRRWSWEEKAQIVAESLAPNAVARAIARRYGLHRNQLYAWRKELRQTANEAAEAGGPASLDFVPVVVTEDPAIAPPPRSRSRSSSREPACGCRRGSIQRCWRTYCEH